MIDSAVMQKIAETYLKSITSQDVDGVVSLFAEDATVEDPIGSDAHIGIEKIRDFYTMALKNHFICELTGPVRCAKSSLAFPFLLTSPGIRTNQIIDVFDLNADAKIQSMKAYWGPINGTSLTE